MYENDNYSGTDTGVHTAGQFSGAAFEETISSGRDYGTGRAEYNAAYREVHGEPGADNNAAAGAEKDRKKKKSGGFVRKALLSVSLGLLFGIFAGLGFYGVRQAAGLLGDEPGQAVSGSALDTADESGSEKEVLTEDGQPAFQSINYITSDVSEVVEDVMPAMVSIINSYTSTENYWGRTIKEQYEASGSGIIVAENAEELLIVTNQHVVADADSLEVTFIDGTEAAARIKGMDSEMDLAVIAVSLEDLSEDTKVAITVATLGNSDELKLGEPVIAIGNALGYGQSVTNGIVSALDREIKLEDGSTGTFIQTNAAINYGNSGGALLNIKGEVIGINSNKFGGEAIEGMGYAIPITSASPIIADLMERQTRNKVAEGDAGYIGIELQEVNSQIAKMYNMPEGVFVVNVIEGGAADKAGIMSGDIIVKFDGEKISSYSDLQSCLQYYAVGDSADVTVMRQEKGEYVPYEYTLTLGKKPSGSR
ncbi:MAG: trypsin-like peptidase domain-containing protein [Lachnospiraceae bacterium]|nr:trypsin-like peptidase domain-containing protein [Lachnospiraceae bacterium]